MTLAINVGSYINRRQNSSLSVSPRVVRAATAPSGRTEPVPLGAGGSFRCLMAKPTATTMAVKTAAHNITITGIWAIVLHHAQPLPTYHVVIALPPKMDSGSC